MSILGVLGSTLRVLMRLFWTRTCLGTLGVPRVTLGVTGPDANPKFLVMHYLKDAKAHFSASISESETLREPSIVLSLSVCVLELKVSWCVSEEEGQELMKARA